MPQLLPDRELQARLESDLNLCNRAHVVSQTSNTHNSRCQVPSGEKVTRSTLYGPNNSDSRVLVSCSEPPHTLH
eukprot:scaffold367315_cov37-Prasinocladus_malaysianus.AAC.1